MTMKARLITIFAALCLLTVSALAESAGDIRRRMEQRLPQIDALKAQEVLGENNRGLLEVRGSGSAEAGGVVADENRDREAVYALIAKETGASADSVGRARAKQIASNSRSGVWVQDESGAWKKK
jgi:uncharacterized protein YdbL (DUF1318 family)